MGVGPYSFLKHLEKYWGLSNCSPEGDLLHAHAGIDQIFPGQPDFLPGVVGIGGEAVAVFEDVDDVVFGIMQFLFQQFQPQGALHIFVDEGLDFPAEALAGDLPGGADLHEHSVQDEKGLFRQFLIREARPAAAGVDREEYLVSGFVEMGLFERSYLLMGMEEALMAYYTHPEEMSDLCSAIADYKIAVIRKYHQVTGMDILWYGDDWGTQSNLFLSPEIWRKVIRPHTPAGAGVCQNPLGSS